MDLTACQCNIQDFQNFIEGKTVAIVGPAATLESSHLGSEIDKYEVVCRLNHHLADSSKMVEDYGSRNDIVFSGPNLIYCHYDILEKVQPKFICFPRSNSSDPNYYRGMISHIRKDHPNIQCFHIGNEFANSVEAQMGTSPNTGLLAICFLLTMPIKKLFVAGFDFYQNKKIYLKSVNSKHNQEIKKNGFIKHHMEHDLEYHLKYFSSIYEENRELLHIDDKLSNILSNFKLIKTKD